MRRACAYRLRDRIFIHPESKTTDGVWLATAPFVSVPLDSPPEVIGDAIQAALVESKSDVLHPTSWAGLEKPRLQAAGSKAESSFIRGARLVNVEADGAELVFGATHNGGSKGNARGFSSKPSVRMRIPIGAPYQDFGATFLKVLELCSSVDDH